MKSSKEPQPGLHEYIVRDSNMILYYTALLSRSYTLCLLHTFSYSASTWAPDERVRYNGQWMIKHPQYVSSQAHPTNDRHPIVEYCTGTKPKPNKTESTSSCRYRFPSPSNLRILHTIFKQHTTRATRATTPTGDFFPIDLLYWSCTAASYRPPLHTSTATL